MKSRKPVTFQPTVNKTQRLISEFHIKKRFKTTDLIKYQNASVKGALNAGKWQLSYFKQLITPELRTLTMLDVGSINGTTYEKHTFLNVTCIDLNPQSPNVLKQDFLKRPPNDKFHIVGLSLVLNFVPTHQERGAMLAHARSFLKPNGMIYIVLPLPCITNSRYLTHTHFLHIMDSLEFRLVAFHFSKKLAFYVFDLPCYNPKPLNIPKYEHCPGAARNNFCISLDL
jgi:25S rRNA (adenine2142-N1)-methyltransferase